MTDHAGTVYLEHIRDQLAEQRDRKKSLERRGQASVATSAALVTLLVTLADDASGLGVWLLVAGALFGVVSTVPAGYAETKVSGMRLWLPDQHWCAAERYGEQAVAKNVLDIVAAAKWMNKWKAACVVAAVVAQVLGVAAITATLT